MFTVLNLAVFLIRALSVWHYGTLFSTSGGESLVIYSVWKRIHLLQVYEWPFTFPFSLSLYNYLSYDAYGAFLKSIGVNDAGIIIWGRLLTSAFAIVGAIAQWKLVQTHLNLRDSLSGLSLFFALGLWLNTSLVRWWALTIRPDMAAVALVMIALYVIVRRPSFAFAYAGGLFYFAWSFKQSVILTLVGICFVLLFQKRWGDVSMLAAVFAVMTSATILFGTPQYRFCILVAPKLVGWFSIQNMLHSGAGSLAANAYWVLAPIVMLLVAGMRRVDNTVRLLSIAFAFALVAGLVAMQKEGASDNYLLEAFVTGSTLLQIAVFTVPERIVSLLVLFGCVQPTIQLGMVPSGRRIFGTVQIASAAEYSNAVALRERLTRLRKPIFTSDECFSQPWISTGDSAPAIVIEPIFHEAIRRRYKVEGIEGMLQRGDIPTVMIGSRDRSYQMSLNPSYEKIGQFDHDGAVLDLYVFNARTRGAVGGK